MAVEFGLGFGTGGEVQDFAGIGVEVEELFRACAIVEHDVFVAGGADHAAFAGLILIKEFSGDEGAVEGAAFENRPETDAAHIGRRFDSGVVTKGWDKVSQRSERRVFGMVRANARSGEDERNARGLFVESGFLGPKVTAQAFAMVGEEGDDGVAFQAGLAESVEHLADAAVHVFDHSVVVVDIEADVVATPGAGDANALGHEVVAGAAVELNGLRLMGIDGHVGGRGRVAVRVGVPAGAGVTPDPVAHIVRIHERGDLEERLARLLEEP